MKRYLIIWSFLWVLLPGCVAQKQKKDAKEQNTQVSNSLPEWVLAKPADGFYYYGLGSARIIPGKTDHIQAAREQALKDLAGEIQTAITGTSFLTRYETNLRLSASFVSTLKAQTNVEIDGYEQVNQSQDGGNYYVLYRLDKLDYQAKHKQKKDNTLTTAALRLKSGDEAMVQGRLLDALKSYIQGLDVLRPYYAESMQYPTDQGFEDIGALLLERIFQQMDGLQWQFSEPVIQKSEHPYTARFYNQSNNLNWQALKIQVVAAESLSVATDQFSDQNGTIRVQVQSKQAAKPGAQLMLVVSPLLQVDSNSINPVLVNILKRIEKRAIWPVFITPPSFFVQADERILNQPAAYTSATYATRNFLEEQKAPIVESPTQADFVLKLDADTKEGSTTGGVFVAYANISIQIIDQKTKLPAFNAKIEQVKGVGLDYMSASKKAYAEARKLIRETLQRFWNGERN